MNRRNFFRRIVPGAAVAVGAVAAQPEKEHALSIDAVVCPKCGAHQLLPRMLEHPTPEEWVAAMTTPHEIRCYNTHCDWQGIATHARRI